MGMGEKIEVCISTGHWLSSTNNLKNVKILWSLGIFKNFIN